MIKKNHLLLLFVLLISIFVIMIGCAKQSDTDNPAETDLSNSIDVNTEKIEIGKHIEYGPYELKKGDIISCDITWENNDGNLYLAVGAEYGSFDNGLITSGTDVCVLEETLEITKDGIFYIFIGSQKTDKANIENVKGTITISTD